jgi:hypothetical protein
MVTVLSDDSSHMGRVVIASDDEARATSDKLAA